MSDAARPAFAALFEELKRGAQQDFLRAKDRREAVDIMLAACEALDRIGFGLSVEHIVAASGAVHLCADIMLLPPDVRGAIAGIQAVQRGCDVPVLRFCRELLSEPEIPAGPPVADVQEAAATGPSPDTAEPSADAGPDDAVAVGAAVPSLPVVGGGEGPSAKPPNWTAEEDARAVDLYVAALMQGTSANRAGDAVAAALGRSVSGTKFRYDTKLKQAVMQEQAARLLAGRSQPAVSISPAPVDVRAKAPAQAVAPEQVSVAAPAAPAAGSGRMVFDITLPAAQREMRDHLNRMGNPPPFTALVDYSLVSDLARGLKLPFIATDLGIDMQLLQRRWAAMINPFVAPRGGLSINDQQHLLAEVKARMLAARECAA